MNAVSCCRDEQSVKKNSAALVSGNPDVGLPRELSKGRFVAPYDALGELLRLPNATLFEYAPRCPKTVPSHEWVRESRHNMERNWLVLVSNKISEKI